MYLYLQENIEGCGGEIIDEKYHLIDLLSIPNLNTEKGQLALKKLDEIFGYKTLFIRLLEDITDYEDSCSLWGYDSLEHDCWVECLPPPPPKVEEPDTDRWEKALLDGVFVKKEVWDETNKELERLRLFEKMVKGNESETPSAWDKYVEEMKL